MHVNICLFRAGLDRKSLNAFQLCNTLARRGHEVSVTTLGEGHEHAWFPLAVKPRHVKPSAASQRVMLCGPGRRLPCDISINLDIAAFASALPRCDLHLCCDIPSWRAALMSAVDPAWLWLQEASPRDPAFHSLHATAPPPGDPAPLVLFASTGMAGCVHLGEGVSFEVLKPGIDLDIYRAERRNNATGEKRRDKNGLSTVVFLGDEGGWSESKTLKNTADMLGGTSDPFNLVFCGSMRPPRRILASHAFRLLASPSDLAELYAKANVVVGCYPRGVFPLAPLEAMACGAPTVISSDPCVDYAQDGVNALLTRGRDAESLAEAISSILTDERLAAELSSNAIRSAAEYSWESSADRFEELARTRLAMSAITA